MVTVLYRDDPKKAVEFMAEHKYTVPLYLDPGERAARTFGTNGVPETYVIGKTGMVERRVIGPLDFYGDEFQEFIDSLLAR